jgi:hypothetical protein
MKSGRLTPVVLMDRNRDQQQQQQAAKTRQDSPYKAHPEIV